MLDQDMGHALDALAAHKAHISTLVDRVHRHVQRLTAAA